MAKEYVTKFLQTKLAVSERAFRLNEPPRLSIYDAVKTINAVLKTPSERRALAGSRVIECRGYRDEGDVLGLYLVGYVPNDSIGIVPHKVDDLALMPPPEDADFLDGELMALIAKDAIIVIRLGMYESAINNYLEGLAEKAGLNVDDARFVFKNRTDIDKLKVIENDGVASIRFNGVANAAAVNHAARDKDDGVIQSFVSNVWTEIQALTYGDMAPRRASENLKVEVFLKYDRRSGTRIDQEEIKDVAERVFETNEGFEVVTLSGRKIHPEDVLLNKRVSLQKYGKSVAFNDVLSEMIEYYNELNSPAGG